jgi:hypothetical protein
VIAISRQNHYIKSLRSQRKSHVGPIARSKQRMTASKRRLNICLSVGGLAISLLWGSLLCGCSGSVKLNPEDLINFVAADLKAPRETLEVSTHFRTSLVLQVNHMDVEQAQQAMRDFIGSSIRYFQRDGVNDFLNDTLVFVVSLKNNRSRSLRWTCLQQDMNDMLQGRMTEEQYIERCVRVETWAMELD